MSPEERAALIDQLDRSFQAMPEWAKVACKHSLAAPSISPSTGQPYTSFREVISDAGDDTLETLREDFEGNGDLLPVQ